MAFFHLQKTSGLLFVGIGLLNLGAATFLNAATKERRPNVVFILADDLGWSDTTLFGTSKLYETPNIERLAGQPFARERSVTFDILHDSQMHRYDVEFVTSVPLDSIRLDPSRGRGTIEIDDRKLQNQDGGAIKTWDF